MNISPKRLKEIENIPDEAINTSDIPELDDRTKCATSSDRFWENAKMVEPITKQSISIRLDSDVLEWFKSQGKGYQTFINKVLRTYVEHQKTNIEKNN